MRLIDHALTLIVNRGKGSVHIKHFLGLADLSEFCRTNQGRAMWLICDYHMILHYSLLLLLMRAVDALPCQNDTLS